MGDQLTNNSVSITTVIPTYRRPQLLRRAVKSALNQTYPHIRVCIYDNASGDETKAVAEELMRQDSRVSYYCHSANIGSLNNFNFGMQRVDTEYFSVLSDDDVLLPDFYTLAVTELENHPEAILAATQTITVHGQEIVDLAWGHYPSGLYRPLGGLIKAAAGGTNSWTGTLYRRAVIHEIGLDETMAEGPAEQDFLLRAVARFPYVVIAAPGGIFVSHSSSVSSERREFTALAGYRSLSKKFENDASLPSDIRRSVCRQIKKTLVGSIWSRGWVDISRGEFPPAIQAGRVLRYDLGQILPGWLLEGAAKLCQGSGIFYRLYQMLNRLRHYLISVGQTSYRRQLQAKYGPYLRYLADPS